MTLGVLIALYDLFFGDFLEAVLGCQQVAACSSSKVAPSGRLSRSRQTCCLVFATGARYDRESKRHSCCAPAVSVLSPLCFCELPLVGADAWHARPGLHFSAHQKNEIWPLGGLQLGNRAPCAALPPPKAPPLRRGALAVGAMPSRPPTTSAWTLSSREKSSSLCGLGHAFASHIETVNQLGGRLDTATPTALDRHANQTSVCEETANRYQ